MTDKIKSKIVFIDLLGKTYDTEKECKEANHQIHLVFRKYIETELIRTFSDGCVDMMQTSNELWKNLEFTSDCIKRIYEIEISR